MLVLINQINILFVLYIYKYGMNNLNFKISLLKIKRNYFFKEITYYKCIIRKCTLR